MSGSLLVVEGLPGDDVSGLECLRQNNNALCLENDLDELPRKRSRQDEDEDDVGDVEIPEEEFTSKLLDVNIDEKVNEEDFLGEMTEGKEVEIGENDIFDIPQEKLDVRGAWKLLKEPHPDFKRELENAEVYNTIVESGEAFLSQVKKFVSGFFNGSLEQSFMRRMCGARVYMSSGPLPITYIVACDTDECCYARVSRRLCEMQDIANAGSPCESYSALVQAFGCTIFASEISHEKLYAAAMVPVEEEPRTTPEDIDRFARSLLKQNPDTFAQLITGIIKFSGLSLKDLPALAIRVRELDSESVFVRILEDEVFLQTTADIISKHLRLVALESENLKKSTVAMLFSFLLDDSLTQHKRLWNEINRKSFPECNYTYMFPPTVRSVHLIRALAWRLRISFAEGSLEKLVTFKVHLNPSDICSFNFALQGLGAISRSRGIVEMAKAERVQNINEKVEFVKSSIRYHFQAFESYARNSSHYAECQEALRRLQELTRNDFDVQRYNEFSYFSDKSPYTTP